MCLEFEFIFKDIARGLAYIELIFILGRKKHCVVNDLEWSKTRDRKTNWVAISVMPAPNDEGLHLT